MNVLMLVTGWIITYTGLAFVIAFFTLALVGFHREGKARLAAYAAQERRREENAQAQRRGRPTLPHYVD